MITRKIQLHLEAPTKEEGEAAYAKLLQWQQLVSAAANRIVTHHYIQENMKEMIYLTDGVRVRLSDHQKDAEGVLTTSRQNSTYRLLSAQFKGQIPMSILNSLNARILSVFDKEKGEYREGKRSLRTYRRGQPIPVVRAAITHLQPDGKGEYRFSLFGFSFRTNFGRDASGNCQLFDRIAAGEAQLRDSSLEIRKNKLFLLAVVSQEKPLLALSPSLRVEARLSLGEPIIATLGEKELRIGSREEYLHRRLAIQEAMQRTQAALRYSKGGKGRGKKLRALQRFHEWEKNYIRTRLHQYSARLVRFCCEEGAGVLVLRDQAGKETAAREDAFLLRNWSYYGLKEMIGYKAAKYGITLLIE